MEDAALVHQIVWDCEGVEYLIEVFSRPGGRYFARTAFNAQDVIISDGITLEETLLRHRDLLPLAVSSRQMHISPRLIN